MYAKDSSGKTVVGTLMRIEEDPNSRYRFEIWFDYTRETMNTVSEGAMVAVPNFFLDTIDKKQEWSSVVEISTLLPVHYAIAQNQSGFPGFLEEAARSAAQDWIDQETQSTDDTTKIRCIAIPTNLMMNEKGDIREEQGLPMVGHPASLLDTATTERFANLGIDQQRDDITRVGPLIRDESVSIFLRVEEALRTHFAVFGFTGAGKSNLLSTIVAKFLMERQNKPPVKLVVLDLMGEFSVLLMDLLVQLPNARLLAIGPETLPDSVLSYYGAAAGRDQLIARAAADLARTSLYPKRIKDRQNEFEAAFSNLLRDNKIRVWQEADITIGGFIEQQREQMFAGVAEGDRQPIRTLLDAIGAQHANAPFGNAQNLEAVMGEIQRAAEALKANAQKNLRKLRAQLEEQGRLRQITAPANCRVTIPQVAQALNSVDGAPLVVVQSGDPDKLREFSYNLGMSIYNDRRRSGQITPLVSFIFDEADEFIPLTYDKDESGYAYSTKIATTLARRGRKFGLGIGIATQRVTYLNTSIMAQPHTYFISKLPRKSDRERVCEAFGISEDMFRQTFKFKKGNWLLVSHDATGLESVPLPIRTDNADERILSWLTRLQAEARPVARR